jgi:hypothetical protein
MTDLTNGRVKKMIPDEPYYKYSNVGPVEIARKRGIGVALIVISLRRLQGRSWP